MVQRGKKIGTSEFQVVDVIREVGNKLYVIGDFVQGDTDNRPKKQFYPSRVWWISDTIGVT